MIDADGVTRYERLRFGPFTVNTNTVGFMGNNNIDEPANGVPQIPKKAAAFTLLPDPVVFAEGEVEGDTHKFEAADVTMEEPTVPAPAPTAMPDYENLGELPASYSESVLFLTARDPRWLFAYWDFDFAPFLPSAFRGGIRQFFLSITTADGVEESLVEIKPEARNWYVPVTKPSTSYYAEIGFFEPSGAWHSVVASGFASTPGEAVAGDEEVSFATVPAHLTFERLLDMVKEHMAEGESLISALSRIAGEGRLQFRPGQSPTWTDDQKKLLASLLGESLVEKLGMGSEEIDQILRKQLTEKLHSEISSFSLVESLFAPGAPGVTSLFSGVGASWSAQPFGQAQRGFYMHVNAEIIFYGGTDPNATVWVDGKEIKLNPDGTFRYHFTLPDGDFAIPIVAQSPDKVEQRSASLSFVRGTSKVGKVDDTGQPAELSPLIGRK
jgi:hypothetical protein